jgi:uncharacterized protein (UPF0303 family)
MTHTTEQELENVLNQETNLRFDRFDEEDALRLGLLFTDRAAKEGLGIAVDISTKDRVLFHCSCRGAQSDNDEWIIRKKRLVNRFGRSSYHMWLLLKQEQKTIQERFLVSPEEYAPFGGSFPINVKGTGIIGTITVSGLPHEKDHALVVETVTAYLKDHQK